MESPARKIGNDLSPKLSTKGNQFDQNDQYHYPDHDGLQVVPPPDGLQIAAHEHDPTFNLPQANAYQLPWRPPDPEQSSDPRFQEKAVDTSRTKRICGIPPRRFLWIGLVVFLLLALVIVLATVLGVVLSRNSKKSTTEAPAINSTTPSSPNSLAFNGTGLALSVLNDGSGMILGYAQQSSGELHEYILRNGQWSAQSSSSGVVSKNAKVGAPVAAISYTLKGASTRRVFYIDNDNVLQEALITNTTNAWVKGPLGELNRQPTDSSNVGLCACWNDQYFGQPSDIASGGIRLYFGDGHEANVQEMGWSAGNPQNQWNAWYQFPDSMATAGVSCSTNGSSIINVYMTSNNNGNPLTQWVYDYNYPVSTGWRKVSTNSQYTQNNSPISAVNNGTADTIYYQTSDLAFARIGVDNSVVPPRWISSERVDKLVGYNNSKIAAASSQGTTHVVLQASNSHVTDLMSGGGKWSSLEIPIRG